MGSRSIERTLPCHRPAPARVALPGPRQVSARWLLLVAMGLGMAGWSGGTWVQLGYVMVKTGCWWSSGTPSLTGRKLPCIGGWKK